MRANALARLAAQYADQGDKELIEPTKERLRELSRRHYEQAAAGFDDVLARLHDRPAAASPARRVLVRASTFQRAAALIALQRYQQAVDLCMSALPRYQTAPESVAVYVQLAVCHRRLGNADQARTALALAKVALDRIGDDASLVAATGFGRAAWDSYLTWLRGLETI
jgi:tetratricopeptide (TPR) repeat protein